MDKKNLIEQVVKNVKACRKCRLFEMAKNPVPGEGSIDTQIVFIGEAPGETEDATGRPFVGRAGMLLENSLKKIGLTRKDVWIGNIIKHRPPGNREPLPDEVRACAPYLDIQLKAISPKLIVTLGRYAMEFFYKDGKISKDHGVLIKVGKYVIYPIYHPAAALRSGLVLREYEEDFVKIPDMLKLINNNADIKSPIEKSVNGQIDLGL